MGAHISTTARHRSTANDTLTNMISSIGELNRWDNDATNVRAAVTQSITDIIKCQSLVTSPTPRTATSLSFFKSQPQSPRAAAASAADEMFDLSGARRVLREVERLFDDGRGGSIAEAAAFPTAGAAPSTPHSYPEYNPPPSLYPLIAPASKLFTQVALLHAAFHKDSPPAASRSGSRVGDSPSGSRAEGGGGESSTETLIENENDQVNALRLSIAAKWSFIRHLINKTAKSARFAYQLKTRIDFLNKRLKPKRFDRLSHVEQLKLRTDYDETTELLNKSLLAFDRKRAAIPWLYQDYYLTLAVYQVDQLMQAVSMAKQSYKQESNDPMALNEFDQLLFDCEARRRQLDIAFQHNERESLSLGLLYIDRDGKGYIEPSQAAELTAKLWATIDTAHRNQITAEDLQKAIQSLSDQLEHLHNECRQIEAENAAIRRAFSQVGQLQLTQNERRLADLNRRRDEIRQSLTGIYSFFHRAFGRLVFGVTEDELPNHPRIELLDLLQAIDKVIHHNRIDPLIESEQKFFAKIRPGRSPPSSSTSPQKGKAAAKTSRQPTPVSGNGSGNGNGNGARTAFLGLGIDYDRFRRASVSSSSSSSSTPSASTPKSPPKFSKSLSSPPSSADRKQDKAPHSTTQYPTKDFESSSRLGAREQTSQFHNETPSQMRRPSSGDESAGVVFHKDAASQSYERIKHEQPLHSEETSKSLPPLDLNKDAAAAEGPSPKSSWTKESYSPGHPPRQSAAEFEKNVLLTPPPPPPSTTPKTKKSYSLSSLFQALSHSSTSNQSSEAATSTTSAPSQSDIAPPHSHELPRSQLAIPVTTETVSSPTRPTVTHRYV